MAAAYAPAQMPVCGKPVIVSCGVLVASRETAPESIVGIGGLSSVLGAAKGAHKSATKDGMSGMIRGMATDLGRHNINCNIAVVGVYDTDRASGSGALIARGADTPIPMGRKGVGQDMADTIRFLVGPKARYITGQTIHVNGGAFLAH